MITIRNAVLGDEEGIATVHVKSWQETYPGMMPQEYLDQLQITGRKNMWGKSLAAEGGGELIFVALEDDQIIGFVCGGEAREDDYDCDCELYAIYLYGRYKGQGIGKKLFSSLTSKLISKGKKAMQLWVLPDNPTCKFYSAVGGVITSCTKTDDIGGREVIEVLYKFDLLNLEAQ
ncbi:MAG: GNAT family N-acetyltransferase [Halobacteriovoraceae bacterium]|mgnify:CR=1 FL=1|jgi:GNAT superfamily N-acetyltransferase|nr:GNAT family N-acetyltransferase [Halobacteriovoraceae bacterium]MBT5094102.1 GNAT family N-acetyltransferase [Halobacteriovoraceae bacterium]